MLNLNSKVTSIYLNSSLNKNMVNFEKLLK